MSGRPTRESDARLLDAARDVVVRLTALLRACGLYVGENAALRAAAEALRGAIVTALDGGIEFELTVRGDSIYVGGLRLRESIVASTAYQRVVEMLRGATIATLRVDEGVTAGELELLARLISEAAHGKRRAEDITAELALRGAGAIAVDTEQVIAETPRELDPQLVAKRIYLRSIAVVKNVFHALRQGDRLAARRVKRVVQEMIESLEGNSGYLLNLTSLKNYDEYTFNHSVNTSVLAVALGRHVGLERRQLYALGQAGMLHDLGKLCLPLEILNKPTRLTPAERAVVELHPADGFLSIADQMGVVGDTLDVALAAYEHHVTESGKGYPPRSDARRKRLLSRIVSIVDCYDAMTSARVYRDAPITPPETLAQMFQGGRGDFDPMLLRCFMNLMGVYPIGTAVLLSDGCIGLVVAGQNDPELRHLPLVRVMVDADGRRLGSTSTVDLAATAKETDPLVISHVVNGARFGLSTLDAVL